MLQILCHQFRILLCNGYTVDVGVDADQDEDTSVNGGMDAADNESINGCKL